MKGDKALDLYYRDYYQLLHKESKMSFFNSLMHKRMEARYKDAHFQSVLELGCGNFEHTLFVKHKFDQYVATDIRQVSNANLKVFQDFMTQKREGKAEFRKCDAMQLPFKDGEFDRVLSGCLILHMVEVETSISEWLRVLKPNGKLDLLVPCEGGLFLRLFRRVFTERFVRKLGIPISLYRYVNNIDHVNSFLRAKNLTEFSIRNQAVLEIQYYPFIPLSSWYLNIFSIFRITKNEK